MNTWTQYNTIISECCSDILEWLVVDPELFRKEPCSTWNIHILTTITLSTTASLDQWTVSRRSRIESTWYCVPHFGERWTGNTVWSDSSVKTGYIDPKCGKNYAANVAPPVVLVLDHVHQSTGRPTTGRGAASITTAASLSDSNSSRVSVPGCFSLSLALPLTASKCSVSRYLEEK